MSYILDALRKSEQERQLASGHGAGMLYPLITEHGPRGRLKPILLAAAAATLVVGLITWMWLRPSPTATAHKLEAVETAALPARVAVPPSAAPAAEYKPPPPRAVPKQASAAPLSPATLTDKALPEPAPKKSTPAIREAKPASPTTAVAEKTERVEKAEPGTEAPKGLPALVIGGYIHDEQGANLAIVNDKLVREGEEVAPGVRLEKIVDDSAVFSYKGHRFRR